MASSSDRQQIQPFLQLLFVFLLAILWASRSPVFAIRYNITAIVNITNSYPCEPLVATPYDNICVSQYLSAQYISGYEFGWANRMENPGEYTLSVFWTYYGLPAYRRIIWSANRNRPVKRGAQFTFVRNGSLILYDSDGSEVWSTHTDGMGALGLELNETYGEFRLYGDGNQTVWSTFQDPTDTVVAGQQLMWGMQMVSGTSSTNSSEGAYSLVMEPAGMVLYASLPGPQPYYVWNGFAESADDMPVSSLFQTCNNPVVLLLNQNGVVSLITDANKDGNILSHPPVPLRVNNSNYTTSPALCNLKNSNYSFKPYKYSPEVNTTFMVLESDGSLRVYVFSLGTELTEFFNFFAENQCDLPATCGGYGVCTGNELCECPVNSISNPHLFLPTNSSDPTQGCFFSGGALGTQCTANASQHQQISQVKSVDYFSNKFTDAGINTSSMAECESLCLNNCSCTASFYHSDSKACYSVIEPLLSLTSSENSNITALVKVPGVAPKKSSSNVTVGVGTGVSCFLVVSVVVLGLVVQRSLRKAKLSRGSKDEEFLETLPGLPPRFSKKELDGATMGFTKMLGSGGYGTVYEGLLLHGSKIAVKKLKSSEGNKDFRAEMATLGSIHHVNLVRLRGFCAEGVENMLVYEYMPNGSLDRWLFRSEPDPEIAGSLLSDSLDWGTRFKIALGTARGLAYLHEECSERIIHLDIKPQNILLDEDFNPKLADFGLSKLVDRSLNVVVTTMRGTPGYLAPEWLLKATVTEKADVYSYGIVLLELVAGRMCMDDSKQDPKQQYVPAWLIHCIITHQDMLDIADPRLDIKKEDEDQIRRVIHIALQCIQEEMTHRPSMGIVVQMLEGLVYVPDCQTDTLSTRNRFAESMNGEVRPSIVDKIKMLEGAFYVPDLQKDTLFKKNRSATSTDTKNSFKKSVHGFSRNLSQITRLSSSFNIISK